MGRFTATKHCAPHCAPGQALDFGRPRIWEPMFSEHLELSHVHITNQAFWAVHPCKVLMLSRFVAVLVSLKLESIAISDGCDDVYIGHVNISAPRDEGIANDDGIDPDSTGNVLVEDCWVSVGDNSVAIKSGMVRAPPIPPRLSASSLTHAVLCQDFFGRRFDRPSFNHVYRNSTFTCETFAIGSVRTATQSLPALSLLCVCG